MADVDKVTPQEFAKRLKEKYPQYANVEDDRLVQAVLSKYPEYRDHLIGVDTVKTGTISGPPKGIAAVKSKAYTGLDRAENFVGENLPTIGGVLGGVVGLAGGPAGAVTGATLGGAAGRAAGQLREFSKGKVQPSSKDAAIDIGIEGAKQGAMEAGGQLVGTVAKLLKPASREALMGRAMNAATAERNMRPLIREATDELDKTVAMSKVKTPFGGIAEKNVPQTVGDFKRVIEVSQKRLDNEFNIALNPIAGQRTVPVDVANAIKGKITPAMANTPEGLAESRALRNKALQFENKEWTYQQLNDERMRTTARLNAYYKQLSSGNPSMRVHADIAGDKAAEDALKDMLYKKVGQSSGKGQAYIESLKRKQGAMIEMNRQMEKEIERLSNLSLQREGSSFLEKAHVAGYAHPSNLKAGGVTRISPSAFIDPEKAANKAVTKAFAHPSARTAANKTLGVAGAKDMRWIYSMPMRYLFMAKGEEDSQ